MEEPRQGVDVGDQLPQLVVAANDHNVVAEREFGDAPRAVEPRPRTQFLKGRFSLPRVHWQAFWSRFRSKSMRAPKCSSWGRSRRRSARALSAIVPVLGPRWFEFVLAPEVLKAPHVFENEIRVVFGGPEPDNQPPGRQQNVPELGDLPAPLTGVVDVDGEGLDPKQPRPVSTSESEEGLCKLGGGPAALSVDKQRRKAE